MAKLMRKYSNGTTVRVAVRKSDDTIQLDAFREENGWFETKVVIIGVSAEDKMYIPYLILPLEFPLEKYRWSRSFFASENDIEIFGISKVNAKLKMVGVETEAMILGEASSMNDGIKCLICKNFIYMAAPNRPDGKFLCHSCKPHAYLLTG